MYLQRVSLSKINDDKAVDVLASLLLIGSEVTYIMNCFIKIVFAVSVI